MPETTTRLTDAELIMPSAVSETLPHEVDKELRGYAVIRRYLDTILLCDIYVPTHMRRQGIGNLLMDRVVVVASNASLPIKLFVAGNGMPGAPSNKELKAWYERRGFEVEPRPDWGDDWDRLMLWRAP